MYHQILTVKCGTNSTRLKIKTENSATDITRALRLTFGLQESKLRLLAETKRKEVLISGDLSSGVYVLEPGSSSKAPKGVGDSYFDMGTYSMKVWNKKRMWSQSYLKTL
jgi:hypothetical protein